MSKTKKSKPTENPSEDLRKKAKKTKGRIKVLRALPYRGHMIYIRIIDDDIFEWLTVYESEIYAGYLVIKPEKGKKRLSVTQQNQSATLALQGALATLDMKLGIEPDEESKKVVKAFEESRGVVENAKKEKEEKGEKERLLN